MKKNLVVLLIALAVIAVFVGCSPEVKTYVVTFDPNGGTDTVKAQTIEEGKTATKPTTTPSHVGWGFLGWSTVKDDATTEFDFDKETIKSDITLYALWKTTYSIGETGPAGGYIFYDCDADNNDGQNNGAGTDNLKSSECGWRYLEAAESDLSNSALYAWGLESETVSTKTGIGEGKNNTELLSSKGGSYAAANGASGYEHNGFDDWFLPSKDELNLMFTNLAKKNICSFATTYYYWSSSESNVRKAWRQYFVAAYGTQIEEAKSTGCYVRPCRSF